MDYKEIIDNLSTEKVVSLLRKLGAATIIEREDCIITNTICHNENAEEASLKLYYYKDNKVFVCYTSCQIGRAHV